MRVRTHPAGNGEACSNQNCDDEQRAQSYVEAAVNRRAHWSWRDRAGHSDRLRKWRSRDGPRSDWLR